MPGFLILNSAIYTDRIVTTCTLRLQIRTDPEQWYIQNCDYLKATNTIFQFFVVMDLTSIKIFGD